MRTLAPTKYKVTEMFRLHHGADEMNLTRTRSEVQNLISPTQSSSFIEHGLVRGYSTVLFRRITLIGLSHVDT